jgi:hypothetical protein
VSFTALGAFIQFPITWAKVPKKWQGDQGEKVGLPAHHQQILEEITIDYYLGTAWACCYLAINTTMTGSILFRIA